MKEVKNIAASVKAKLKEIAKNENKDFNSLCLQYCQERFLYRLSLSNYKDIFILKGGLSLLVLDISSERPTKDMDFLAQSISNNIENIKDIFYEIVKIEYNDGISFDINLKTEAIAKNAKYEGIRVKINSFLERSKYELIVDIGFSDKLLSFPKEKSFPILLNTFNSPVIKIYPTESIIAEKFEAIIKLYTQNSRIKDFYDIYFISKEVNFKYSDLKNVILETFKNRNTSIEDVKRVFEKDYKNSILMQKQWSAFLSRNKLKSELTFEQIMEKIEVFLLPIFIKNENEYFWESEKWNLKN